MPRLIVEFTVSIASKQMRRHSAAITRPHMHTHLWTAAVLPVHHRWRTRPRPDSSWRTGRNISHATRVSRPKGRRGLLCKMLRELPKNWQEGGGGGDDSLPMTRAQIFTGTDDTISVDLFTYGHERRKGEAATDDATARRPILDYAARIADGEFAGCGAASTRQSVAAAGRQWNWRSTRTGAPPATS